MKQLERRGTDSPGPVCGQKSQVPSNGEQARIHNHGEGQETGGCKANEPTMKKKGGKGEK